ncbi:MULTISPECIES: TetR/AcrR family transcriptional regulator [unclassified Microbacterium]|uniref:TetR/AcrR family transcriptional regulator n=1 Tax=unclassified Microbacterium TaxID=2609290 RepID=UPI003865BD57
MGRILTYDRDRVVRAARDVFWNRGYTDAGIGDLEQATGLGRSSLYHAFGSKKGLFEAVVAAYLSEVVRTRLAPLQEPDVSPEAIDRYIAEMRSALTSSSARSRSGCLLLNAACSPIVDDEPDVRALVTAYTDELRRAVAAGVAARRPDLDGASSAALAEVCASLVISALVAARTDADAAARTLDTIGGALDAWDRRSPR